MALRGPLQFDRVGSRLWPLFLASTSLLRKSEHKRPGGAQFTKNRDSWQIVAWAQGLSLLRINRIACATECFSGDAFPVGALCFSRGSWTSVQRKKQSSLQWALALGISAHASGRVPKCSALKRMIQMGAFFRSAEALLPPVPYCEKRTPPPSSSCYTAPLAACEAG